MLYMCTDSNLITQGLWVILGDRVISQLLGHRNPELYTLFSEFPRTLSTFGCGCLMISERPAVSNYAS